MVITWIFVDGTDKISLMTINLFTHAKPLMKRVNSLAGGITNTNLKNPRYYYNTSRMDIKLFTSASEEVKRLIAIRYALSIFSF